MKQDENEIYSHVEELMDRGEGLVIELARLDRVLAQQLHEQILEWRILVLKTGGLSLDGLDALTRYYRSKGE